MTQLQDIICSHTTNEEKYYQEDSFIGRILIYDNHKFEGIVADYFHDTMQLVFGVLTKDGIRLYRTTPKDEELPKVYRAKRSTSNRKFEGKMLLTEGFIELPLENCKVSIVDPDTYREVEFEKEQSDIKEAIKIMRKRFGSISEDLYADVFWPEIQKEKQEKNTK